MKPFPEYFDLDSDEALSAAFGRELDLIDEQQLQNNALEVISSVRKNQETSSNADISVKSGAEAKDESGDESSHYYREDSNEQKAA